MVKVAVLASLALCAVLTMGACVGVPEVIESAGAVVAAAEKAAPLVEELVKLVGQTYEGFKEMHDHHHDHHSGVAHPESSGGD